MKRPLTPDEEKLWKQVMEKTAPLKTSKRKKSSAESETKPKRPVRIEKDPIRRLRLPYEDKMLTSGSYAGIDSNTAERFRKGHYPIDATLDLHGLTHDKAQAELYRFLGAQYERGSRCLLVITGK